MAQTEVPEDMVNLAHAIVAVGSPVFFGFMALKHHTASRWIRCVFVLLAVVGISWGILGCYGWDMNHILSAPLERGLIMLKVS